MSKNKAQRKCESLWCWNTLAGITGTLFIVEGYSRSSGLIYIELLDLFEEGAFKTSLVLTMYAGMAATGALVVGYLSDRIPLRIILATAGILCVTGLIVTAFAPTLDTVIVGTGVMLGFGVVTCNIGSFSTVSKLFVYNRPLACAYCMIGGSVGSIVLPILVPYLVEKYGLRGSLLIIAGFHLHILIVPFLLAPSRIKSVTSNQNRVIGRGKVLSGTEECESYSRADKHGGDQSIQQQEYHQNDETEQELLNMNNIMVKSELNRQNPCEPIQKHYIPQKDNRFPSLTLKCKTSFYILRVLCRPSFLCVILFYLTFAIGFSSFVSYIPIFLESQGAGTHEQSLILALSAATNILGRLICGTVGNMNTVNIYMLAACFNFIPGVGMLILSLIKLSVSRFVVFACMAGAQGIAGVGVLMPQMAVDSVGIDNSGTAIGLLGVMYCIGYSLAPIICGLLRLETGSYHAVPFLVGAGYLCSGSSCILRYLVGKMEGFKSKAQSLK